MSVTPIKPVSRLARTLAGNLQTLIGPSAPFADVRTLGDLPRRGPVGVKPLYRAMRGETDAQLDTVEKIAEATGIAAPLLLCEGMDPAELLLKGGIRPEIRRLIAKLTALDNLRPLMQNEIEHIETTLDIMSERKPRDNTKARAGVE